MKSRFIQIQYPLLTLVLILTMAHPPIQAQFEQKLSVNLSGGLFKTVGAKYFLPDWSTGDYREPALMPNFNAGFSFGGSFQVNINRHLSLEAYMGIMISNRWYFNPAGEVDEPFNYLYYEVYADTIDYIVVFSGENDMTLTNLVVGLAPKYYFLPGNKLNPFVFAGITYNVTHVNFIDNEYEAFKEQGVLDEWEGGDINNWFSDHAGLGMSVGTGVEYGINDNIGLFAQAAYYFIPLKEEAFIYDTKYADFHSINIHLGVRISFLKSKDL